MKKKSKYCKRLLSLLLCVVMLMSSMSMQWVGFAASYTKTQKSYEIAVVFDNSGSMYRNSKGWCRAKYAMEIFASMLNYQNGDKLSVFPMWEVTTDGSTPESGGSYAPIEVKSKEDIDKISNLYTVHPSNTPFAPISEAYTYLSNSSATEKWLIVLTDGEFNEEARGQKSSIDLQERLLSLASNEIKVQYLGFGAASVLKSEESKGFFAQQSSDTSIKDDLIGICNAIFQRSVLSSRYLQDQKLELGLSMKNIIVFVQGANAKITGLTNEKGETVPMTLDSGQRTFSSIKAKGYDDAPVDETLSGQVVTFSNCAKGNYQLQYSDADAIQIFYEPDVDIFVSLTNSDGEEVDLTANEISADEYKMHCSIIDNVTKEDVTKSPLLGKDVKMTCAIQRGDAVEEVENDSTVSFVPNETVFFLVEATYLKNYKLTTKDDENAYTFNVIKGKSDALKVSAKTQQSQSWYTIREHEEWKPIRVDVTLNDMPLTAEQLATTELSLQFSKEIPYYVEQLPGESAYNVYIGYTDKDTYVEPQDGVYSLKAGVTALDEYGDTIQSETVTERFEVHPYSAIWRWLSIVLILLLIALIILWILTRKAFPKSIVCQADSTEFDYRYGDSETYLEADVMYTPKGKIRTISISTPPGVEYEAQCDATFTIKPVDKRYVRSKDRRICITEISSNACEISINNVPYEQDEETGDWIKYGTTPVSGKPSTFEQVVKNGQFSISAGSQGSIISTLSCKLKHK